MDQSDFTPPDRNAATLAASAPNIQREQATSETADFGPIERTNLASMLGQIGQRLLAIESRQQAESLKNRPASNTWLELTKIVLGGWAAFGILFLLLFYAPLRETINALPGKLRDADEIGAFGVSLKTTLRIEAEKAGEIQLSRTIPALSAGAVGLLLKGAKGGVSLMGELVSEGETGTSPIGAVSLPTEQMLRTLEELESERLVDIRVDTGKRSVRGVSGLRAIIRDFKLAHPAVETQSSEDSLYWKLAQPKLFKLPSGAWYLTDQGQNAASLVIRTVSVQLSAKPAKNHAAK